MKIVMFCDKYLYRKLNMAFPKYSENDAVIGSLFSEDEFDNFHVLDKDFNIKTGFIFAGMLVLIGLTCYATLNWN